MLHQITSDLKKFQSTHSRGVRPKYFADGGEFTKISIHALTRSATGKINYDEYISKNFNPRTHEECDHIQFVLDLLEDLISIHALTRSATCCFGFSNCQSFISIHALTRSATVYYPGLKRWLNFNPRTHEECDLPLEKSHRRGGISIHALTRSATGVFYFVGKCRKISIHALTRSATLWMR